MWASPLKKPKPTATDAVELKPFKAPKPRISRGAAKAILGIPTDPHTLFRLTDSIDNLVRTEGLPPQLVSNDFVCLLKQFCGDARAETLLNRLRTEFGTAAPVLPIADDDASFGYLVRATAADPRANPALLLDGGDNDAD